MKRSRLRPLLACFALFAGLLLARLHQIQLGEHEDWAREAARLVRKGREEPYRRGRILDASGTVLAQDEELRAVELVYRDFRRGHPLGQVAHARSLLEGRPVSLPEARANLLAWAHELLRLSPADVRAMGRGAHERLAGQAAAERLGARRAGDLTFYLLRLLGLDPERRDQQGAWRALVKLAKGADERRSYLELGALVRQGGASGGLTREEAALAERLEHSLRQLGRLAEWIRPARDGAGDPLTLLLEELEATRRSVEDACAAKLFAEAAGFVPGRIEADTLLSAFDHGWIADLLGWDGARLAEWATAVRAGWQQGWRDAECLPQLYTSLATDPEAEPSPGDFLARLAVAYEPEGALRQALSAGPRPWRELDELAVFAELDELLVARVPAAARALAREALPIQLAELRADPDDARCLPAGAGPDSFRAQLAAALTRKRIDIDALVELARTLIEIWELRYQEALRAALDTVRHGAARDELGEGGGLLLAPAGRERAAERAEYFLKDFGTRPRVLSQDGQESGVVYDVVYLLTRYEFDFPGFRVRALRTRARPEVAGGDRRPAERLVGFVSTPTLEDLVRQQREAARLRELKADPDLAEAQADELRRLIGRVLLPGEARGVSGIEAFFDRELCGQNGFAMTRGLSEVFGAEADDLSVLEARDGEDVVLTLESGLQRAAQRCLRSPREHDDLAWQGRPVGAVVLLAANGDVLAAASEPDDESLIDPAAEGQRQFRMERTLRKPTFQPPGSVIKPFVAMLALERGLDPARTVLCGPIERGGSGYADLRCWNSAGHGQVDLRSALVQSCNAYFAWVGETLETQDFAELGACFGLGRPTGVRRSPAWDPEGTRRYGLIEDRAGFALPKDGGELTASQRRRAANGLGVVEATPMQIARAVLALACGEERELRLVQRVGARELAPAATAPLSFAERHLARVRSALRGVAEEPNGTAHAALSAARLGFEVAVKTGSADLASPGEDARVPKHAWVAGWVPAEKPELVFVVFEHDTLATSSHGAIYLARDVLLAPEVRAWLASRGVAGAEEGR